MNSEIVTSGGIELSTASARELEKNLVSCARVGYRHGPNFKGITVGSSGSAGYDLAASEEIVLLPGETFAVPTDLFIAIPPSLVGLVFARSGLSLKGISLANGVGVIDSDYRGEVKVPLRNNNLDHAYVINAGDRIAQLMIQLRWAISFDLVEELDETGRGDGGFGSSGK